MNVIAGLCLAVGCVAVVIAGWAWRLDSRSWANRWVALNQLAYAFWAFWSATNLVAPDAASFWFSYRMVILGSVALHPLGVAVVVSAVQVKAPWSWFAVLASALVASVVVALSFSGWLLIEDYRTGPWGNVGVPTDDPLRFGLVFLSSFFASVIGWVVVAWKSGTTPSRRMRSAIVLFVVLGLLAGALGWFTINLLWLEWGYPDATVLAGIPYLVLYGVLISRYRYLRSEAWGVDDALFRSLDEALCLLDPAGRIQDVSPRLARILERSEGSLRHRPLAEVLPGWSAFPESLAQLARSPTTKVSVVGSWGGQDHTLTLEPLVDRFGDLVWVLARWRANDDRRQKLEAYGLSEREKHVALHLIDGLTGPEIARTLGISPATVKNHLHSLFQKTGTSNRVELMRALVEPGSKVRR